MPQPQEVHIPPDRQQARLDFDLLCVQCGYNLRTLEPAERCPECGSAVSRSLRGDWLINAPRNWLQKVATGFALVGWSRVGIILAGADGAACLLLDWSYGVMEGLTVVTTAALAFNAWGTLCCTAREPYRKDAGAVQTVPLAIRATMMLQVICWCAEMFGRSAFPRAHLALWAVALFAVLFDVSMLIHARSLMARIPDKSLAGQAEFLAIGYVMPTMLGFITLSALSGSGPWIALILCAACLLMALVLWLFTTSCLIQVSQELRRVARQMTDQSSESPAQS